MGNHRRHARERSPAVDIAVASAHRSQRGSQVGAGAINQRLAKCRAASLIADERAKHVRALNQGGSQRGAHRFLTTPEVNTADDFACFVQAGELIFQDPCQQHRLKCGAEKCPVERKFFGGGWRIQSGHGRSIKRCGPRLQPHSMLLTNSLGSTPPIPDNASQHPQKCPARCLPSHPPGPGSLVRPDEHPPCWQHHRHR